MNAFLIYMVMVCPGQPIRISEVSMPQCELSRAEERKDCQILCTDQQPPKLQQMLDNEKGNELWKTNKLKQ